MTATGGRPSPLPAAAPRTLPCHPAPHTCRDASIPVPTWWLSPSPPGPFSNGLDFNTSNLFSCSQPEGTAARQSQPLGSICPFSPPAHSCQTGALTEMSRACPVSSPGSDTASTRRKDADNGGSSRNRLKYRSPPPLGRLDKLVSLWARTAPARGTLFPRPPGGQT